MLCEVVAPNREHANWLAEAIVLCVAKMGNPRIKLKIQAQEVGAASVTLHLDLTAANPRSPYWCLVCRLSCACRDARVGVVVEAAEAFAPKKKIQRRPGRPSGVERSVARMVGER